MPSRCVRDGDWLKADGTTLGSDNGVGVAAALAVMESTDIAHGPLEFVFTIDEETGLTGAAEFPGGLLKSKYFLNLDNEEKGTLCIGCAGGIKTTARRKITLQPAKGDAAWRIKVSGLKGGHSGVDIHQGRGNALRILGGALAERDGKSAGGDCRHQRRKRAERHPARGVRDRRAGSADETELKSAGRQARGRIQGRPRRLRSRPADHGREGRSPEGSFARSRRQRAVDLLATLPHGVLAMSPDVPGLVQNSTNLATIATKGDIGRDRHQPAQRHREQQTEPPRAWWPPSAAWPDSRPRTPAAIPDGSPNPTATSCGSCRRCTKRSSDMRAELIAMHAGLECGVIGEKYPGMQMVSFGPTIVGPHSPAEKVEISSVQGFWKYLKVVLERI